MILILLTVVTSVSASAQNFTYEGFLCELRNGLNGYYVEIEGLEGDCPSVLEIPSEVVYDGITYPVTNIGDDAFSNCNGLTSVTLPNSITEIGQGAFDECSSLESVYSSDLEAWCNIEFESTTSNPLYWRASLYLNSELVTDVIFPDSLTTIKPFAFNGCISLTSVTIPDSVTEIGEYAFSYCTNLPSVTIPNSVTEIGEYAFNGCSSLTSITIPNSVTEIRAWTFGCCDNLTSVTIPASVTKIGENAFGCVSMTSVYISDLEAWCNIEFQYTSNPLIGGASLYLNGELVTDLIIPESVTTIKPYTFFDCSSLTSVTIHNSVTEIGEYAFEWCHNLSCLTIPDSVTKIGECAFSCCCGLTSLTIGESVSELCTTEFEYCEKLSIINIRAKTPPAIVRYVDFAYSRENPFEDVVYEKATLYVPAGCGEAYKAAQGWSNFNNIVEGEFSGIDEVETEVSENGIVGYYNAQGAMSNEPWQGLNIVVYGDGSHRKVIF